MSLFKEAYEMCKKIPHGKVATYGQIAIMIGRPRCARQVGWALNSCSKEEKVPCHRVVNRFGGLCKHFGLGRRRIPKRTTRSRRHRSKPRLHRRLREIPMGKQLNKPL